MMSEKSKKAEELSQEKEVSAQLAAEQGGASGDPNKIIPSFLENKFADFTYRFVKYVPETVHPNVVTGIGIIGGLIGGFSFFLGTFSRWFFLLGILGLITHIVCDNFDGYMARNRNQKSQRGGFFDLTSDIVVCTVTALCIGLSSYAHMEVLAFGAPIYGIHMVITMHYVMYYNEFPFPPFGPFEIHCAYVLIAILNIIFGEVELFWIGDFPVMLDDIVLFPAIVGAILYAIKFGMDLFFRLKKEGR